MEEKEKQLTEDETNPKVTTEDYSNNSDASMSDSDEKSSVSPDVNDDSVSEKNEKENKNIFGKKKKTSKKDKDKEALEELGKKLAEISDKYIRLAAEFDNFRKRTIKEKADLLKYGAENSLKSIIPVIDDFDRALKSIENIADDEPVKVGVLLIYNKFKEYLTRQGIKEIECKDGIFNVDEHEAITRFPAPSEELKGKVIDVVEKGYYYHDKVIRFAKVVIGE